MPIQRLLLVFVFLLIMACQKQSPELSITGKDQKNDSQHQVENRSRMAKKLTPTQYRILRQKGPERPFTNEMKNLEEGTFSCVGCGNELFLSKTKYDSGCSWPSFYDTADKGEITEEIDLTHGMVRTEVLCTRCDGHLGHVFQDGPRPTGLRYCINGTAIQSDV